MTVTWRDVWEHNKHHFLYQLKFMRNPAALGSTERSQTADKVI